MTTHTRHTWVLRDGHYECVSCPEVRTVESMERLGR